MNFRKSQTATEYLIILAVVIIIALVAINTLGGFPGIGANNVKKISELKLQTDTVGIESYSIGTNSSLFKLKNNYFDTVTVTEFRVNQQSNLTCNSSNTIPALPIVLNIGESKIINCTVVNSSSYIITDRQTPVVGISYTDNLGATRTAGNVQSYNSTNSVGGSQSGAQTYTPNSTVLALRNGLVVYYPLDGNTSDESVNGNNGINNGSYYTSSGKVGGAYSFDGGNDYIMSTSNVGITGNNNFTISFWATTMNGQNANDNFVGFGTGTTNLYRFGVGRGNDNNSLMLNTHGSNPSVSLGNLFTEGIFNHIVITKSGNTVLVYTNGVQTGSTSIALSLQNSPIEIGSFYAGTTQYAHGSIDEVALYNRSLNATEVLQLYNGGNGLSLSLSGPQAPTCLNNQYGCSGLNSLLCTSGSWVNVGNIAGLCGYAPVGNVTQLRQGLVAYYPLNGNITDYSGNGNNGTNAGTATVTASGKLGGAYSFDGGSNSYLSSSVAAGNAIDGPGTSANSFTFSVWAQFGTLTTSHNMFIGKGTSGTWGNDAYMMFGAGGNYGPVIICLGYINSNGRVCVSSNATYLNDPTWHNWAVTHDLPSKTFVLYRDGVNVGFINYTNTIFYNHYSIPLTIGAHTGDCCWPSRFRGTIDEVAIWNRSLSQTEILQIYNNSNGFSLI